jgi:hypothetical protein
VASRQVRPSGRISLGTIPHFSRPCDVCQRGPLFPGVLAAYTGRMGLIRSGGRLWVADSANGAPVFTAASATSHDTRGALPGNRFAIDRITQLSPSE